MEVLIDSHALFWYFEEPKKLSIRTVKLLDSASLIVIPTIVLLELEAILAKNSLREKFKKLLAELIENRTFLIHPLNLEVIKEYTGFSENLEMHDRVIVTTAKLLNLPIISKDEEVSKVYPRVIW